MNTATRVLSALIAAAAVTPVCAQTGASPEPGQKIALRVLFVGAAPGASGKGDDRAARTRAFADFLGGEFESVRVAARDGFEPESARDADVVLLDWSQSEMDVGNMRALKSPLGPRDEWDHPTVLLGSAGLLLAAPWELKGAHG